MLGIRDEKCEVHQWQAIVRSAYDNPIEVRCTPSKAKNHRAGNREVRELAICADRLQIQARELTKRMRFDDVIR
jgi:hypothetical protein